MMMAKFSTLLLIILCFSTLRNYGWSRSPADEDLELERELQSLNKPPLKTIKLENGDNIVDCIDIYSQPALDNPSLKNHKIQLRPTSFPAEIQKAVNNPIIEAWSKMEACPNGTVPIYRTTKDDLIRARTLSHQMFQNIGNVDALAPKTRQVSVRLNQKDDVTYYGVVGSGSVYQLALGYPDWSSAGNVWVEGASPANNNVLIAGWLESSSINSDDKPRLFVYWTADGDKTGCFDLLCQGFVQVDQRAAPKVEVYPVSQIGGDTYVLQLSIYQDPVSGNWWLMAMNYTVGYWPKEIVPGLANGAGGVGWGGMTMAGDNEASPPMGSGQFPDGFYDHAAFFRDIRYVVKNYEQIVPSDSDPVSEHVDASGCYALQNEKDTKLEGWRYRFLFGGPTCGN